MQMHPHGDGVISRSNGGLTVLAVLAPQVKFDSAELLVWAGGIHAGGAALQIQAPNAEHDAANQQREVHDPHYAVLVGPDSLFDGLVHVR
jgi:hypothetical protein